MSLEEILSLLTPANTLGGLGILVLFLSLVQVSPIRINPWDAILGWLGNKTNASVKKTLDEQGKKLSTQNAEFREFWVDYQRESILRFSRSVLRISHTAARNGTMCSIRSSAMRYSAKRMRSQTA